MPFISPLFRETTAVHNLHRQIEVDGVHSISIELASGSYEPFDVVPLRVSTPYRTLGSTSFSFKISNVGKPNNNPFSPPHYASCSVFDADTSSPQKKSVWPTDNRVLIIHTMDEIRSTLRGRSSLWTLLIQDSHPCSRLRSEGLSVKLSLGSSPDCNFSQQPFVNAIR